MLRANLDIQHKNQNIMVTNKVGGTGWKNVEITTPIQKKKSSSTQTTTATTSKPVSRKISEIKTSTTPNNKQRMKKEEQTKTVLIHEGTLIELLKRKNHLAALFEKISRKPLVGNKKLEEVERKKEKTEESRSDKNEYDNELIIYKTEENLSLEEKMEEKQGGRQKSSSSISSSSSS